MYFCVRPKAFRLFEAVYAVAYLGTCEMSDKINLNIQLSVGWFQE